MEYLPIFQSRKVMLSGSSRYVEEDTMLFRRAVLLPSPGDSVSLKVEGRQVGIVFFRHGSSGVADVVVGEHRRAVDLFSPTPKHSLVEMPLPSSAALVPLTIRAASRKNEASRANEVWVEAIYVCDYLTGELKQRIHETVERPPFQEADLNQLTDVFKWYDPEWMTALECLKTSPRYRPPDFVHRKSWEWGQCLYGLDWLGMLSSAHRALGVGVGREPIPFFLSNYLSEVVATDLYPSGTHWSDSGAQEGSPDILENPDRYAPFPYRRDRLRFMRMDGTRLDFPEESFDVVWSCSSIEHFGGHQSAARSMREIERVLKPGGVAAIITEFVLPDRFGADHSSFHPEFFNLQCLYDYVIRPVPRLHLVQDIDFSIPSHYVRRPCRLPEEAGAPHEGSVKPHIVLSEAGCLFTSVALFFRKQGAPRSDSQRRFVALREADGKTLVETRPAISLEDSQRLQRDHMIRMTDVMHTSESKAQVLELMHRRYETYLTDLFLEGAGRLLDIGCGYADIWFRMLQERGFTYYGVDLHEDVVDFMASLLTSQGDEVYMKQGMLEQIPFPDQFFDVVYASHILEHTVDITQALREIRRVVKDDGYLIFAVPCGPDDEPAHLHKREKEGWIEDLTSNGFEIEKCGQFDFNQNEFYGRAVKRRRVAIEDTEQRTYAFSSEAEQLQLLREQLQAAREELWSAQQMLERIETSRAWQIEQKLANSWPGRILDHLIGALLRAGSGDMRAEAGDD